MSWWKFGYWGEENEHRIYMRNTTSTLLVILASTTFNRKNFRYLTNARYVYNYSIPDSKSHIFHREFYRSENHTWKENSWKPQSIRTISSNIVHVFALLFFLIECTSFTLKFHCHTLSFTDLSWHLKFVLCGFTTSFACFILTNLKRIRVDNIALKMTLQTVLWWRRRLDGSQLLGKSNALKLNGHE